jgi:DNA-directed RNA polymerase specialized sigma24 family protein
MATISDHEPSSNDTGRWQFLDQGEDDNREPYLADDTATVVDQAIGSLLVLRFASTADAGSQLSAIASLVAELDSRVPDAVVEAREQDYSWDEIAARLGRLSGPATRRRFSCYVALREEMPLGLLE